MANIVVESVLTTRSTRQITISGHLARQVPSLTHWDSTTPVYQSTLWFMAAESCHHSYDKLWAMWMDFCTRAIKFCLPTSCVLLISHHTHDKMYQVLILVGRATRLCWRGDGLASGDGWSTRHSEGNSAPNHSYKVTPGLSPVSSLTVCLCQLVLSPDLDFIWNQFC